MGRAIVIPLYDHTTAAEIEEILRELGRLELAMAPVVVSGYLLPGDDGESPGEELGRLRREFFELDHDRPEYESTLRRIRELRDAVPVLVPSPLDELHDASEPIAGRPGWRRDRGGREWYSAAWLGDVA